MPEENIEETYTFGGVKYTCYVAGGMFVYQAISTLMEHHATRAAIIASHLNHAKEINAETLCKATAAAEQLTYFRPILAAVWASIALLIITYGRNQTNKTLKVKPVDLEHKVTEPQ